MKRPAFVTGGTFACATWVAFLLPGSRSLHLSLALTVTAVLLMLLRKPGLRLPGLMLLSAALALGCQAVQESRIMTPLAALEGQEVAVRGLILAQDGYGAGAVYTLQAEFPEHPELPGGRNLRLRYAGELSAGAGGGVALTGILTLPENSGYRYYRAANIVALIRPVEEVLAIPVGELGPWPVFRSLLLRWRTSMRQNLSGVLSPDSAGLVTGMVLGINDMSDELYDAVSRAGTAHLLAVSGLHLSIVTAFVAALLRRTRMPRALQGLCTLAAAFLFAALVGFSASIMRAFVMTGVMVPAQCSSRKSDGLSSLGMALLILCIACPHWVLGRALWLSASATAGIILCSPRIDVWLRARFPDGGPDRFLRVMLGAGGVSGAAALFSAPFFLLSSGWLSPIAPVSNMLVAPFVPVLLVCGMLCALGAAAVLPLLALVTDLSARMVLGVSLQLAHLPLGAFSLDEGWMLILLVTACGGGLVLFLRRASRETVACALALLVCCYNAGSLSLTCANRSALELVTLEESDVMLLLRDGQAVLLGSPTRYDSGVLSRYLNFRGVRRISAVIAPDYPAALDSGIVNLQQRFGMDCLVGPDDFLTLSQLEMALPGTQVLSGGYAGTTVLGDVQIRTFAHSPDMEIRAGGRTILKNHGECAIIAEYGENAIYRYPDGSLNLPAGTAVLREPAGQHLFGELRLLLEL